MIDPGTLNKRITLQRPELYDNGYQETWRHIEAGKVWANVYWVSDREKYAAGAVNVETELRITIRKRDINHDWQLVYQGSTYAIVGIKPALKDDSFIEISCARAKV